MEIVALKDVASLVINGGYHAVLFQCHPITFDLFRHQFPFGSDKEGNYEFLGLSVYMVEYLMPGFMLAIMEDGKSKLVDMRIKL